MTREIDKIYARLFNNIIFFISIKEYIINFFTSDTENLE